MRDKANRSKQQVLRQRAFFVETRTRVKNRIHALIDKQPYEARKSIEGVKDLFGKVGMQWLRNVELPPQERKLLNALLNSLEHLDTQISESDGLVKQLFQQDEDAHLLKTIPGIGVFSRC